MMVRRQEKEARQRGPEQWEGSGEDGLREGHERGRETGKGRDG